MNKLLISMVLTMLLIPAGFAFQVTLLDTDPSPAVAGEYVDVTLRVSTSSFTDDQTESFSFGILETPTVLVVGENVKDIGFLEPGTSISRTFRIFLSDDLPEGVIKIVPFINQSGDILRFESDLFVQDAESEPELLIGEIRTTPNELLPDSDDNLFLVTMLNLGDKDADLVTAEIKTDSPFIKPSFSYSLTDSVASVNSGEEKDLSFTIDIKEGAEGQIPADLYLTYRVEESVGGSFDTVNKIIPFTIDLIDAPFLKIESAEQLSSFKAGTTENVIRLSIKNVGNSEAEEVRVRLIPDISYPFSFEQLTEYVASEIAPGETATIEFTTEVFETGEDRTYSVTTRLESLVGETRYAQDDFFSVNVQSAERASVTQIALWVVGIIIVISIVFGILGRRKKK